MPTPEQISQAIHNVNDQQTFIQTLLINTLDWQIPAGIEQIEDISFDWTQEEIGADDLDQNLIDGKIYQIRPMSENQPWGIFILEFQNPDVFTTGRGMTGPLRKVLRGLVPKRRKRQANLQSWNRENLLFICTHQYKYFRFAYFKTPQEKGHAEPLAMFGWSPDTNARTACEYGLPHLVWPEDTDDATGWINKWSEAFNVEAVTKKFYDDYEKVFINLQAHLDLNDENKKMFAQVLMNRLMFLRFVERKCWLKFRETSPKEYLKNLYQAGGINGQSWYQSRLKVLFFEGLAKSDHNKEDIVGKVPYLNGGLFMPTEWDDLVNNIADEVFEPILGEDGLLYRYNFTVEESTPLDIEVAVDPEMLGKVFEELVTGRHERGSYYTPRTVVSFMCKEALKGYIGKQYADLIDEHKIDNISLYDAKEILSALESVKIVDPACGSGAYLLGMLHELFELYSLLDTKFNPQQQREAHNLKLNIIRNNLYGVDIDEFAVNIARLRLWLSLAVEFEGDNPEPLPNLDFKIEIGDSLTSPDPTGGREPDLIRKGIIDKIHALQNSFFYSKDKAKQCEIKNEIAQLKQDIADYTHPNQTVTGFDWPVEFCDVWADKKGFDIVLANPPYGANGAKVGANVRDLYFNPRDPSERGQSKDTYGLFMARGLQLLHPGGMLCYIVSNTWRTIKTHRPLRKRILDTSSVVHIFDLPPWIFKATVNTCILTLQKKKPSENHTLIAGDLSSIEGGNWTSLSENLRAISEHGVDLQTDTYARYTYTQNLITSFTNLPLFIASPKLFGLINDTTCEMTEESGFNIRKIVFNEKTISIVRFGDDYIREGNNKVWQNLGIAKIISGIKTGGNKKYLYCREPDGKNLPIIASEYIAAKSELNHLTDDEKINGKIAESFLVPFEMGLSSDTDCGLLPNYYQPETNYYINWTAESVAAMRNEPHSDLANSEFRFKHGVSFSFAGQYAPTFRNSVGEIFLNASSRIFCDFYDINQIMGILCSTLARFFMKNIINHSVNFGVDDLKEMPFPLNIPQEIQQLTAQIIERQKNDSQYPYYLREQKEIDSLVYELYGLDENDIREIELWYCRRYPKLAEAQGFLVEVREKYADHLARCERILAKPPSYWKSNPILILIAQGEGQTLEFKETLEYDIRQNQRNSDVLKSSLKTIAGFLNSNSATLLIGVSNSGEIKGLDRDLPFVHRHNLDGFELKIRNCLKDRFTPSPIGKVNISFEELSEGTVCRIDVEPSPDVIHLDNDVYVRDGNVTRKLEGRELTDWIQQRNKS